jgi:3',5'-cyclic AMP phosphodiesterase CpdA
MVLSIMAVAAAPAGATVPELITVSDTSMEATWSTDAPSDTTVCVGADAAALRCERQEESAQLHHAAIGGLAPGTRYVYELRSSGVAEPATEASPGSFTTLTPPPGRHLLDIGLVSDVHVGESCSGTAATAPLISQSVPECYSSPRYAAQMLTAAVGELNARHVDMTIDTADMTSSAKYDEMVEARTILGGLKAPFSIVRGNHDRPAQQAAEARCGPDKDCLRTVFFPDHPPGRIYYSQDAGGVHFVYLDANDASGQGDLTDAAQNEFLRADLAAHPRQRTFIVFHEPVAEYADTYALPPVVFGVAPNRGGNEFLALVAANPQVSGVLGSHTHRNFVSTSVASGPRTVFLENAATKEYAGGYGILSVYEGGWMRTFHRLACQFCRQWIETTRNEYNGQYPSYTLGSLSARNFVHLDDCDQPTPPNSVPQAQGGDTSPRPAGCGQRSGFPVAEGTGNPPSSPPGSVGPCRRGLAPSSRVTRTLSRLTRSGAVIRGSARSRGCAVVQRVQVALALRLRSGCRYLRAGGSLSGVRACKRPVWLTARGTAGWSLRRRLPVPAGRYLVRTRASDAAGAVERPRRARVLHRR